MLNKTYLLACIILVMSCTSEEKREKEQLTAFLTKWSTALQNKDESIRRFYDARFVFPKVVFEEVEGLQYSFSVADMSMLPHEGDENIYVRVPFEITTTESAPERGTIELTLSKSDNGFLILDMTQEFALQIKQHTMKLEASKHPEVTIRYDSIMQGILSLTKTLREHYDSVVFMTKVDDQTLFYVVNGSWENPYWVRGKAKEQQNSG